MDDVFDWGRFLAANDEMGLERYPLAMKACLLGDFRTIASLKHGIASKLRKWGLPEASLDGGGETALERIKNTDFGDREFLFLNLMEAHAPYDPPDPYKTVDVVVDTLRATLTSPAESPAAIERAYDDSVRYLSAVYERIFAELSADFDVVVTVSDHGELLGEHGTWGHLIGLYPELTNVPLSIYAGEEARSRSAASVDLRDVHRTVLAAAGCEGDSDGRNLLEAVDDGESIVEYHGITERDYRSLQERGFEDIDYLNDWLFGIVNDDYYGYETFDGWRERGDSPYSDPPERLSELLAGRDVRQVDEEVTDLDEEVVARLEALGYG